MKPTKDWSPWDWTEFACGAAVIISFVAGLLYIGWHDLMIRMAEMGGK